MPGQPPSGRRSRAWVAIGAGPGEAATEDVLRRGALLLEAPGSPCRRRCPAWLRTRGVSRRDWTEKRDAPRISRGATAVGGSVGSLPVKTLPPGFMLGLRDEDASRREAAA